MREKQRVVFLCLKKEKKKRTVGSNVHCIIRIVRGQQFIRPVDVVYTRSVDDEYHFLAITNVQTTKREREKRRRRRRKSASRREKRKKTNCCVLDGKQLLKNIRIDTTMFYYLYFLCLFFNFSLIQSNKSCSQINNKLTRYHIYLNLPVQNLPTLHLCSSNTSQCCPQIYEDHFQNATAMELYQLFELSTISLYESISRLNRDFNRTYEQLINYSRNETHAILERGYNRLYQSYRFAIDNFFTHLLTLTSRTYEHEIKIYLDQLFRQILHISLTLNNNQTISSNYFACLWKNRPFANNPNVLEQQLELNFGKLFHLIDLLKLTHEFVQILSTVRRQTIKLVMQISNH